MLNNFIYAQTKDLFLEQLGAGNILDEAIVFIEDTKEIWNHGTYFGRESGFDADVFAALQQAVLDLQNETADINTDLDKKLDKTTAESTYATKNELPSLNGYLTEETAATIYATISQINAINQNVEHLSSIIVESGDGTKFLSDDGTYKFVETNPFEIPSEGILPEVGQIGKIYLIPANKTEENNVLCEYIWANDSWEKLGEFSTDIDVNNFASKDDLDRKQNKLVNGSTIKSINNETLLGPGNITIDTSVFDTTGDNTERPMSQKATTDAINAEAERALMVENELFVKIEAHEALTQQASQNASDANAYAQEAFSKSSEAINIANTAKNAVAALEGINAGAIQEAISETIVQIEQNTTDIEVLKNSHVVLSEEEYAALELKDPDKFYIVYEE